MAQRMKEYRVEIGDKRRQNFALMQSSSLDTIQRPSDLHQNTALTTKLVAEDDMEMNFLFKSSDLLRTFKQDNMSVETQPT